MFVHDSRVYDVTTVASIMRGWRWVCSIGFLLAIVFSQTVYHPGRMGNTFYMLLAFLKNREN